MSLKNVDLTFNHPSKDPFSRPLRPPGSKQFNPDGLDLPRLRQNPLLRILKFDRRDQG